MKCVDVLLQEHRTIESMLDIMEKTAARLDSGGEVSSGLIDDLLEFFEVFADSAHHVKEEHFLFPAMVQHGLASATTPVNAYVVQHEIGRGYMRELRAAASAIRRGDYSAREALVATCRDYVSLLREHIRLEDHYFLELANGLLTPEEDDLVTSAMAASEHPHAGAPLGRATRLLERCRAAVGEW